MECEFINVKVRKIFTQGEKLVVEEKGVKDHLSKCNVVNSHNANGE